MADITVFKPAALTVSVIDGVPPVDQTALVASLQSQVNSLTTSLATMTSARDALAAKIAAAQAALA